MSEHLWNRLVVGLDDDERIVFPQMYLDNKLLYDKISGIAYLINGPEGLDWVWQNGLDRALSKGYEIVDKVLVVRIRLPWKETREEWLCDEEELTDHFEEYEVLDVFVHAIPVDRSWEKPSIIKPLEFQTNRDKYKVVDIKYLVCWKFKPEEIQDLLNVGDVHTMIGE